MRLRSMLALTLLIGVAPVAAHAQRLELPTRRPGLWELRMVTQQPAGTPDMTMIMCIDAETDREMMQFGLKASEGNCSRFDMKRAGGDYVIDAECAFGPLKTVSKTTISGDFQSSIVVRVEGTMQGVPGGGEGPQPTTMTQTASWKGATCTDGLKPGDVNFNGFKINVKQLKKLQNMVPGLQIK